MALIVPANQVSAPEPGPRRYGLFDAVSGPVDLIGTQRGAGVRYESVTCGGARAYPMGCYQGEVTSPEEAKSGEAPDPEVQAPPFAVYAAMECSRVGYTAPEFTTKITRRLEAGEQHAVESALWSGLDPDDNDLAIPFLGQAPTDITIVDGDLIEEAVAALEDYAYNLQSYGFRAFIHAPVSVASYAANAGLVVQDGRLKRTPYGSVWVFGGGYPGTGPDGAAPPQGGAYMHITGQVQVWRDPEVFVSPVDQTMNRATNEVFLLAERVYAVGFDCLNGRVQYDPLGTSSP